MLTLTFVACLLGSQQMQCKAIEVQRPAGMGMAACMRTAQPLIAMWAMRQHSGQWYIVRWACETGEGV